MFLVVVGLTVYCLLDVAQRDPRDVLTLPKPVWLVLVLVPVVGPALWLLSGRPAADAAAARAASPWPSGPTSGFPEFERPVSERRGRRRVVAPDDDPDFLASLASRTNAEHERLLRKWEADLRERERHLRDTEPGSAGAGTVERPADPTSAAAAGGTAGEAGGAPDLGSDGDEPDDRAR